MANTFDDRLTICIADFPVTLVLADCDGPTRARITDHYSDFRIPAEPTTLSVHIRVEPGPDYIPLVPGATWQIRTAARDSRIEFESHFEKGWVDRAAGQGVLVVRPHGDIENFLRVLYAWFCVDHDSLLLHSCGIIRNGRGYVFFGPSGSGKTTTATLSSAHTILSDDLVIIKQVADRYRVFGVPFRGDLPEAPRTNASAELRGLFAIIKDTRHFLAPLALPEAVARLAQCVPFVMAQPETARRVTDICADLAVRVPVRALHFRRDDGFWEIID
jgi:hypothetical protein